MQLEFRQRLLASTLLISAAAFGTPAFAQSTEANTQEETADVGDPAARLCAENPNSPECAAEGSAIVVTGSRIASPTLTSASPLQIVDAQDIDDSGVVNVQEVLLENPAFGTPAISRTTSNFQTSSVGVAVVDLRNLGTNRTLVLVNGRRFVSGVPGTANVDLNTIPTQFIERIDILTGGASSIYGSDAVAGVVNIIYKDDFEGIELSGQLGVSQRGDDVRKQVNLMMGTNFADGRGNVTAFLGYSDEGAVFGRDRRGGQIDAGSVGAFVSGDPDDAFVSFEPFRSGFNPQGTFFLRLNDPTTTANETVTRTFNPCTGALTTVNTNSTDPCLATGFNRQSFRNIAVPTERYLMALRGNYEITDNITAFMEGTFAKTGTESVIEPFPAASAGLGGLFPATGGRFPIEQFVTVDAGEPLPAGCDPVTRVCLVRNPLVPAAFFSGVTEAQDTVDPILGADGLRDIGFQQRQSSFGNRGNIANRTTFRFLAGLEGEVFSDWRWDAFYSYGETVESQTSSGQINNANFRQALNVIADVNDIDGDGNRTEAICADPQARAEGCVPANIFGANLLSPGAVAYIAADASNNTRTTQKLAGANLSGNLFDPWGAGPIGLAIGTEYRKEFSESLNDALTQVGGNGGNALPNVSGSFDVIEGYAELVVPILSDRPFFETLNLRGAIRVSDYSTVGTTYSWNYGVEYAPVPDIRFRAVMARATRAPNIGELFTPPSQTFPPGLVDPCQGVGLTGDGANGGQGDICRAGAGVLANIAANGGVFTLNQADLQGISGFTPGNPNLEEEKGDSFTAGVVINPTSISWLRNFALTIDYFDIEIDNVITVIPRQFILNECFVEGNADACAFISRRPTQDGPNSAGSLNLVNTDTINGGSLETEGLDVTLSYRQNLENWGLAGNLNARVAYTHVFNATIEAIPGAGVDSFNREIGASRNKAFGTVSYELGDIGITLRGTYIGPAFLDDQVFGVGAGDGDDADGLRVGSEFITDIQFRFTPGDNYEFYVGADNVFDNAPPFLTQTFGTTGTATDAGTYDVIGRRFYAGARLKF